MIESGVFSLRIKKRKESQKNIFVGGAEILHTQRAALFDYEGGCSLTSKRFLPPSKYPGTKHRGLGV
jgi:hypothetical protein